MEGKRSKQSSALSKWQIVGAIVLLVGIGGFVELYRGGIKSIGGLPLADWVVLFVGLIAFLAVMIQIEDQQKAREEERERQKRSLATSLRQEIAGFVSFELKTDEAVLSDPNYSLASSGRALSFRRRPFLVYEGNASKLGELSEQASEAVVRFYNAADEYLELRRYHLVSRGVQEDRGRTSVIQGYSAAGAALSRVEIIKKRRSELEKLAEDAQAKLEPEDGRMPETESINAQTH